MSRPDGTSAQQAEPALPRSQTLDSSSQVNPDESGPDVQDPLANMNELDRWGLKGFSLMMNNFPDYAALVTGTDINGLGLDLNSSE